MTDDQQGELTKGEVTTLIGKLIDDKIKAVTAVTKVEGEQQQQAQSRTETKLDRNSDLAAQVQAELDKIHAGEQEKAEKTALQTRIDALEAAAKLAEKPPVERRRVHKIMGWGE